MGRGRKATVETEDIIAVLKSLPIFVGEGDGEGKCEGMKLKKINDAVWKEAVEKLNDRMTQSNLYFTTLQNRRKLDGEGLGILDKLKIIKFGKKSQSVTQEDSVNDGFIQEEEEVVDQYDPLHELAFSITYHDMVKGLAPWKFHLIYHLNEQVDLYRDLMKLEGALVFLFCINGLIERSRMKNHVFDNVHYYSLVAVSDHSAFPVARALSEKIDKHFATDFLMQFMKSNVHPPEEIIVEHSSPLLGAISLSMNDMELASYLAYCLQFIKSRPRESSIDLPYTVIRTDILKVLRAMATFFKDKPPGVEEFYWKNMINLSMMGDWEEFKDTVISLIIVSTSPFTNEITTSHTDLLDAAIDAMKTTISVSSPMPFTSGLFFSEPSEVLINFVDQLNEEAQNELKSGSTKKSSEPNPYYCSTWYTEFFKLFLYEFPLWTFFLAKSKNFNAFGSTSQLMIGLVDDFIEHENRLSIPEFFTKSVEAIQSSAKVGRELVLKSRHKMTRRKSSRKNKSHCLSQEENWMGRNNLIDPAESNIYDEPPFSNDDPAKDDEIESVDASSASLTQKKSKKKPGLYTTPNPAIDILHREMSTSRKVKVNDPFIKNGKDITVTVAGKKYVLENTAVFDTITRLFVFAYRVVNTFRQQCDTIASNCSEDLCFLKSIQNFAVSRKLPDLYKVRAKFMHLYGITDELDHISCAHKPGMFFRKLMGKHFSYVQEICCSKCGILDYCYMTFTVTSTYDIKGKRELEEFLHSNFFDTKSCISCEQPNPRVSHSLGLYIALDFEEIELEISLNAVPSKLVVLGVTYLLTGLIAKELSNKEETYVCYTQIMTGSWSELGVKKTRKSLLTKIPIVRLSFALYVNLGKN